MPIVARRAPKPQPVWYVTPQGVRIPGPAPQTRLGITAPRSWIETVNPSYYYPPKQAPVPPFHVVPEQTWMSDLSVKLGPVVMWNGTPYQEVPLGSGNYVKTAFGVTQTPGEVSVPPSSPKPLLVLPSVPAESLPPGGQFEIQAGPWKVVLTKEQSAAGAEVSAIDKLKAWLAEETIVAGYANQWFVVGGALAYFLFRKK